MAGYPLPMSAQITAMWIEATKEQERTLILDSEGLGSNSSSVTYELGCFEQMAELLTVSLVDSVKTV